MINIPTSQTNPIPTTQPSSLNYSKEYSLKRIILSITLTVLLAISLCLNIAQALGFSLDTFKFKNYQDIYISPNNPNLLRYGIVYYLEGEIKEVRKEGNDLELTTDIKDLPKLFVTPNTNILIKRDNLYTTGDKKEIVPGKKVNLLLFNANLKEWSLIRVVLLQ